MKEEKKELRFFSIAAWKKEEAYLRMQHLTGWRFTGVTSAGVYHFKKCEPEDVIYQLDYNPDGLAHKDEYVEMFRDCGWEYLQDFAGYSYFRKPVSKMHGQEEIFCDDESRLDMIERVYRWRILPLTLLFLAGLLPSLLFNIFSASPYSEIFCICTVSGVHYLCDSFVLSRVSVPEMQKKYKRYRLISNLKGELKQ